jgi:hypothetical protein
LQLKPRSVGRTSEHVLVGNLVFYRSSENDLGDVGKGRWREMRRLLPALIEYLNVAMRHDWRAEAPPIGEFSLADIVEDKSESFDEIYIRDADELVRLFQWFAFLHQRDGAANLYANLIEELRRCTAGIDRFASAHGGEAG